MLPFDVNDTALRERFLRDEFRPALEPLRPETPARWGGMSAQDMVEHLEWTFRISTGVHEPVAGGGLPTLVHPALGDAVAALGDEVRRYLVLAASQPEAVHTHPLFGPLA